MVHTSVTDQPLSDPFGQWCAWCCRYFDGSPVERHHVFGRRGKTLGDPVTTAALDVRVPVHRDVCHRDYVQHSADVVGDFLRRLPCNPPQLSELAQRCFQSGNMNLALVLRRRARSFMHEPDVRTCAHELSALCVTHIAPLFDHRYLDELVVSSGTQRRQSPSLLLGAANVLLNISQDVTEAVSLLGAAATSDSFSQADLTRRTAKLTYSARIAAEARNEARDIGDVYTERTATVILGWAQLLDGQSRVKRFEARDHFAKVLWDRRNTLS